MISKLKFPRSCVSRKFHDESSSGKRTKSSIGLEGLKEGKLPCEACVVTRDNEGVDAGGLGSRRPDEEVCCVEVEAVRDMSLCDLR